MGDMFCFDGEHTVLAHRHPNGGGWVADTAKVDDSVFVADSARVFDTARVLEGTIIDHDTEVSGNALVHGNVRLGDGSRNSVVTVHDNALVGFRAVIRGCCTISDNAHVHGHAVVDGVDVRGRAEVSGTAKLVRLYSAECWDVSGEMKITGGTWTERPLYIALPIYPITHTAPGCLAIGCEVHDFAFWLQHYAEVGYQNEYTKEQIELYGQWIRCVVSFLTRNDNSKRRTRHGSAASSKRKAKRHR